MEQFSIEEQKILEKFFTNVDSSTYGLINMPEVVKAALFARYSRSHKSLRRLFLDEFSDMCQDADEGRHTKDIASANASKLFERVFVEYGDDSVAQLGGAHIAVEGISNIATKVLERGRLMSYLEQSTRYIRYDKKRLDQGGSSNFLYMIPDEVEEANLRKQYIEAMNHMFISYQQVFHRIGKLLKVDEIQDPVIRRTLTAQALDGARGLLPASSISNVGVFGSGQSYEALLLRMYAHPLREINSLANEIFAELKKVIPSFVKRIDRPERGGVWIDYKVRCHEDTRAVAKEILDSMNLNFESGRLDGKVGNDTSGVEVRLVDWDKNAESKVVSGILQEVTSMNDDETWSLTFRMSPQQKKQLIRSYVGERQNRRHLPGRAFEHTSYLFEVVVDYGAFRDLQRHRMLTIEWQTPSIANGFIVPEIVEDARAGEIFQAGLDRSEKIYAELQEYNPLVAQYAIALAHRVRFFMKLNARELMHIIELRSAPQGHPSYRTVAQKMYQQLISVAQHHVIAESLHFVNTQHNASISGRLEQEIKSSEKNGE